MAAKNESLLYLLGTLSKDISKYSEGKATKEAVYTTISDVSTLFREDEEYFKTFFEKIHSKFLEPLEPPSRVKKSEQLEKGLIKKYGLKHPSINNLSSFYARHRNQAAKGKEGFMMSPFSSAEDFPTQLRTYTEGIITQIDEARSLNRKNKDRLKKRLRTSSAYMFAGVITPIANEKADFDPLDGSSISVGRVFLSAVPT